MILLVGGIDDPRLRFLQTANEGPSSVRAFTPTSSPNRKRARAATSRLHPPTSPCPALSSRPEKPAEGAAFSRSSSVRVPFEFGFEAGSSSVRVRFEARAERHWDRHPFGRGRMLSSPKMAAPLAPGPTPVQNAPAEGLNTILDDTRGLLRKIALVEALVVALTAFVIALLVGTLAN